MRNELLRPPELWSGSSGDFVVVIDLGERTGASVMRIGGHLLLTFSLYNERTCMVPGNRSMHPNVLVDDESHFYLP